MRLWHWMRRGAAAPLILAGALLAAPAPVPAQDLGERVLNGAIRGALEELGGDDGTVDRARDDRHRGVKIPPGHYPPRGSCRVWYPDRPPGQQPPPTSCNVRVPRGAILVRG